MAAIITGSAFGAAITATHLHHPSVILSQFLCEGWTPLQALATATGTSAAVYIISSSLGYLKLQPRSSSPLGLFGTYGGNLVGGSLLGLGMALAGAGPETLVAQAATGIPSGMYAFAGAAVGGILWTGPLKRLVGNHNENLGITSETVPLDQKTGLPRNMTFALFEAACAGLVYASIRLSPRSDSLRGVVGGLLIGGAQVVSLASRRTMIGISGAYEELGNYFWSFLKGEEAHPRPKSCQNLLLGLGTAVGAWAVARVYPDVAFGTSDILLLSPSAAAVGGALMVVGSRVAGGCTSGHGISGLSLLSTASLVTMVSAFTSGAVFSRLVY